ncbi:MAG TPA: DUF559 domain-containing protein [Bacteroidia bacterium]|jgi:very-short-patch-repair endonuclease|nr:DUF559 domain-containing protein [Bacteroidia bacterium]
MKENINLPLYYGASAEIFHRAGILRNNMTEAEKALWNVLNYKQVGGFKFRRQHPINRFIVDFYCHKAKLVIELDGEIHKKIDVAEKDFGREQILKNYGIEIVRFKNEEVLTNVNDVALVIKRKLEELCPLKPL